MSPLGTASPDAPTPSCPRGAHVLRELLELSTRSFPITPGTYPFEIDALPDRDGNCRPQALAILPVVEGGKAIPAGVRRGKKDDGDTGDRHLGWLY
jgi:hypothetical protein